MTEYGIIHVLCPIHRAQIVKTRLWPGGFVASKNDCCWNAFAASGAPEGEYYAFSDLSGTDRVALAAIHEAAHAAACIELNYPIHQMQLNAHPDIPKTAGFVYFLYPDPRDLFAEAIINLAGAVAQQNWLEQRNLYDQRHQVDIAFSTINDINVAYETIDLDLAEEAWTYTFGLVDGLWPVICEVAGLLADAGELTHADVEAVYDDHFQTT